MRWPVLAIVAVAGLVLVPDGRSATKRERLIATQERIEDARVTLARDHGIYLAGTGQTGDAVSVDLHNPSPAKRRYVRLRFGPLVRVDRRPGGEPVFCAGFVGGRTADGPVVVPDVGGLGVADATRALVAAGLTFDLSCRGNRSDRPFEPGRHTPEAPGVVAGQCPAPGQAVTAGTAVALGAVSRLPGGFDYRFGTFWRADAEGAPCKDGRTLEDGPTPPEARIESPVGYGTQLDAGGAPTSVTAVDGTLLWVTTPNAADPSGAGSNGRRLTLHRLPPGAPAPTAVAVRTRRELFGLTAGTDARGRLVVLAIANRGYGGNIDEPDPRGADVVSVDPDSGVVRSVRGAARPAVSERAVALHRGRLVVARRPEPGARRPRADLWTGRLESSARVRGLRPLRDARRFVRPRTRIDELALTGGGRLAAITQDPRRLGGRNEALWVLDGRGARRVPRTRGLPDLKILWSLSWQDDRRLWFGRTDRTRQYQARYDAVTGHRRILRLGRAAPIDTAWAGGALGLVGASNGWSGSRIRPGTLFATGPATGGP